MKKQKEINTKDLCEIIVNAIQEDPYFTKEVLVPKIKTLISMFRLRLSSANYGKILNDNKAENLIRKNELHNLEKEFWKQQLKSIVRNEDMQKYYDLLDTERAKWSNENEL